MSARRDSRAGTFNAITCRENGTRHNRRISQNEWECYRGTIEQMHLANLKRDQIRNVLISDHNFGPTMAQLNTQMQRWDMSHRPHLARSCLDDPITDMLMDYIGSLQLEAKELVITPFDKHRQFSTPQYCVEACCATMIHIHRNLLAAGFLVSLQCWQQASDLLQGLIAEIDEDQSVSISDKTWLKLNYNRLNGSIFKSGNRTSIWSTHGWCDMAEALRAYVEKAQSEHLSSPLAHLLFTIHYRTYGTFAGGAAGDAYSGDREQRLKLAADVEEREQRHNLLLLLMLWCFKVLRTAARPHVPLSQLKLHITHTTEAMLREVILPRILTCHFVSAWIDEPCAITQPLLSVPQRDDKHGLALDVLLPELFAAISHNVVALITNLPVFSSKTFVEELSEALVKGFSRLTLLPKAEYCNRISDALFSVYARSAAMTMQYKCVYSEHLAMLIAHKIMGTGYFCKYGAQEAAAPGPISWMRSAECFIVHLVPGSTTIPHDEGQVAAHQTSESQHYQRADSMASTGTYESRSLSGSTAVGSSPASQSSTILSAVEETAANLDSPEKRDLKIAPRRPILGRSITAGIPQRISTTSSGKGSIYDFVCTSARATAEQLRRQLGGGSIASRTDSRASKMTLGTQYSFRRVFGIEGSEGLPQRCPTTSSGQMSVDEIEESVIGKNPSRFSFAPGSNDAILMDADKSSTTGSSIGDAPALFEVQTLELEPSYVSAWVIQHSAPVPRRSYSAE